MMPRARNTIPKRSGSGESIELEIEETLAFGFFCLPGNVAPELQTLADWRRLWAAYRHIIEPKLRRCCPGIRAVAAYIVGEIPPRPMPEGYFGEAIRFRDDNGVTLTYAISGHAEPEADYLARIGVIDKAEYRRHHEWQSEPGDMWEAGYIPESLRDRAEQVRAMRREAVDAA